MGWFESAVSWTANPVGNTVNALTGNQQAATISSPIQTTALQAAGKSSGVNAYGQPLPAAPAPTPSTGSSERDADLAAGYAKGHDIFYNDPDMQELRNKREDLSKGYNGEQLGALKGEAEAENAGNRSNVLRNLSSKAAKQGVSGARGAAMQGAADEKLNANYQDTERKMTLDNANLVNKGTSDLQDFVMRQKMGELGTGLGYAELGVNDRSAASAAAANKAPEGNWYDKYTKPFGYLDDAGIKL